MNIVNRNALITGVSGFLGRYIARYFTSKGWVVTGIDNSPPENSPLGSLNAYHQLKLPNSQIDTILQDFAPSVFIHCAGRASVGLSITDPIADFYGNTLLTFELLNALKQSAPNCYFIFLSSAAVYGNPTSIPVMESHQVNPISPYGFHKLQCESLCLEFSKIYNIPTACLRIFSAYGPGLRRQVMWDICQKVITNNSVILQGTGQESRDFIHALDIAKAVFKIANSPPMYGEVCNLASGVEVSIADLANLVLAALNYQGTVEFNNVNSQGNPLNWQADISKLNSLGYVPSVPLAEGVKTFATWCRAELVGV